MSAIDRMNPEEFFWPHVYDYTRLNLRRGFMSYFNPSTPTNYATHQLFNSSLGDRVLVLKAYATMNGSGAAPQLFGAQRGSIGTNKGTVTPVWLGERAGNGQHFYADQAAVITAIFSPGAAANFTLNGTNYYPLVVLPPGWGLLIQAAATGAAMAVALVWEELAINDPRLGAIGEMG